MPRTVDTKEYLDMVCALLREGQREVPVPVKGVSMRPFLQDQDMVYLNPIREPVRPGDIVLYLRRSGQYILHRVCKSNPDGSFLMLGDSQLEKEPVAADQLLAKVSFVRLGAKEVRPGSLHWWLFAHLWRWLAPVRGPILRAWNLFRGK